MIVVKVIVYCALLFALALSLVGIASVGSAEETAEVPKYSVGHMWKFSLDQKAELGMLGIITMQITNNSYRIGNYECYEISSQGSGTLYGENVTGTWTLIGSSYYHKSDISWVKTKITIDIMVTHAGESHIVNQIIETTYNPPLEANKGFPLSAGKDWSATTTEVTTTKVTLDGKFDQETRTSTYTINYFVLRTELTTVSAGQFETFVVKATKTDGSFMEYYYSNKAGFDVKQIEYNKDGKQISITEMLQYNYVPDQGIEVWIYAVVATAVVVAIICGLGYLVWKRRRSAEVTSADKVSEKTS